jgi:hypothetical protein
MRMATELFSAYLDGYELNREQARALSDWVKESPENARTLVLITQIHESLDSRMCVPRMLEDLTRIGDADIRDEISDSLDAFFHKIEATSPLLTVAAPPSKKLKLWLIGSGWAAAAVLLLAFALSTSRNRERPVADGNQPAPPEQALVAAPRAEATQEAEEPQQRSTVRPAALVATVEQLVGVEWAGDSRKVRGDQLLQGENLRIAQGILSLTTTVGHAVVIEGPADVIVESPQQLAMTHGRAVGRVGVHGGSLEFSTPTATIRDLGTEFGVEVAEELQTRVAVYDGAIELKGIQEPMAVQVNAGVGRGVTAEGDLLEEEALPHDREFVRLDEVDLRVAGRQGDGEAEALATYYALVRSGKLLAYQGFHAPSRGLERTIGFGNPPIRSTAPLVMSEDLHPDTLVASGAVRLDSASHVFLPIDTRPGSSFARADLIDDRGFVGKDGKELWIAWRSQLHGTVSNISQFGGLSLTFSDTDDSLDTFIGRIHNRNFLGVQFNFEAKVDRLKYELDMEPRKAGVQAIDADSEIHRWVAHVKFTPEGDHLRVWLDVPTPAIDDRNPHFAGSRDDMAFDRVRFAIADSSSPWSFDEVMVAATLDDLVAAERILTRE